MCSPDQIREDYLHWNSWVELTVNISRRPCLSWPLPCDCLMRIPVYIWPYGRISWLLERSGFIWSNRFIRFAYYSKKLRQQGNWVSWNRQTNNLLVRDLPWPRPTLFYQFRQHRFEKIRERDQYLRTNLIPLKEGYVPHSDVTQNDLRFLNACV